MPCRHLLANARGPTPPGCEQAYSAIGKRPLPRSARWPSAPVSNTGYCRLPCRKTVPAGYASVALQMPFPFHPWREGIERCNQGPSRSQGGFLQRQLYANWLGEPGIEGVDRITLFASCDVRCSHLPIRAINGHVPPAAPQPRRLLGHRP